MLLGQPWFINTGKKPVFLSFHVLRKFPQKEKPMSRRREEPQSAPDNPIPSILIMLGLLLAIGLIVWIF